MMPRTDLAIEKDAFITTDRPKGVIRKIYSTEKTKTTHIKICDEEAQEKIGVPMGNYITVEVSEFSHESELVDDRMFTLSNHISSLLPQGDKPVLVVGVGNESITPDALGPKCADNIFSTRHILPSLAEELGLKKLNAVCSISTGVLGQTGIETGEIIKSLVSEILPKAVIVIDALAAADIKRLGKTVQITDTGIIPGSGVGNSRTEISEKTLSVPVIAIGVPTVVDAKTLVKDMTGNSEQRDSCVSENMIVTPREIDTLTERAARLIALSVNCALQPQIDPKILLSVV